MKPYSSFFWPRWCPCQWCSWEKITAWQRYHSLALSISGWRSSVSPWEKANEPLFLLDTMKMIHTRAYLIDAVALGSSNNQILLFLSLKIISLHPLFYTSHACMMKLENPSLGGWKSTRRPYEEFFSFTKLHTLNLPAKFFSLQFERKALEFALNALPPFWWSSS